MLPKNLRRIEISALASFVLIILTFWCNLWILAADTKTSGVETSSGRLVSRVAPGEFLPISVKLINFGQGQTVDVNVDYQILNSNNIVVLSNSETVAVETTASYVKNIQIPFDLPSGKYSALSSITYGGQLVPATSKFEFTVERKIAGIFVSQFILYGAVTILVGIAFAVLGRLIIKRRVSRGALLEYPQVPKQDRLFYEIISDTISQMRSRKGDQAIQIAQRIDGLVINEENGRVLKINKDPAEIVALLVLQYERTFGGKMGLSPRDSDQEARKRLSAVEKNLDIIKKNFSK